MTRIVTRIGLWTFLFAFIAVPVGAQDVTGEWQFTFQGPQESQSVAITLAQDGAEVTGSAMMPQQAFQVDVSDGKVEDDQLTFALHMDFNGQTFSLNFTCTVDGDSMEGTLALPDGNSTPFTTTREEGA